MHTQMCYISNIFLASCCTNRIGSGDTAREDPCGLAPLSCPRSLREVTKARAAHHDIVEGTELEGGARARIGTVHRAATREAQAGTDGLNKALREPKGNTGMRREWSKDAEMKRAPLQQILLKTQKKRG